MLRVSHFFNPKSSSCLTRITSFGAVLEEFEVQDALDNVLAEKDGQTMMPAMEKMEVSSVAVY